MPGKQTIYSRIIHPLFKPALILLGLSAMLSCWLASVEAGSLAMPKMHVYKNGFVERSFSVVIRDDRARCEYLIGLNSVTAQALLKTARQRKSDRATIDAKEGSAQNSEKGASNSENKKNDKNGVTGNDTEEFSRDQEGVANVKESTLKLKMDDEVDGEGEHLTDPDTIKELASLANFWFSRKMEVTCDGRRVTLQNVIVSAEARHPYSMIVRFEFDLRAKPAGPTQSVTKDNALEKLSNFKIIKNSHSAEPGRNALRSSVIQKSAMKPKTVEVAIFDGVFAEKDGAVRYALKTKGSAMIARSNVAAILVRADRIELSELDKVARKQATTMSARIIVSTD